MTQTLVLLRRAMQVYRDGFHASSGYWQSFKRNLPPIPGHIWSVIVGMVLGDAGVTKKNNSDAALKIEQGWKQHAFVVHLFELLNPWCFMTAINNRPEPAGSDREGEDKSFWFRTFGLPQLTVLWQLLYVNGVKCVPAGFVLAHVDPIALAYLIMCDGSTSGSTVIIHTQGFSDESNLNLSNELNQRYGLNTTVIPPKRTMKVVKIPSTDAARLRSLIEPHMIPSMRYKLPKVRSK